MRALRTIAQNLFSVIFFAGALMIMPSDCFAETPGGSNDLAPFIRFTNWLDHFSRKSETVRRTNMANQGRLLAESRGEAMRNLIRSDPGRALKFVISNTIRDRLPAEIATHVERQISGIGDFDVFCADKSRGASENEIYQRFVTLSGHRFRAFVYGRRSGQTTKHGIPLHGIAIGDVMALDESVLRPLQGTNGLKVDLAGKVVKFTSAADLEDAEKQLELAEGGLGPEPTMRPIANRDGTLKITPRAESMADRGKPGGGGGASWTTGNKNVLIIRVDFRICPAIHLG